MVKMEDLHEQLKINIHSILPSISEETVHGIIHAVKYVGIETMSDLQFIQEEDLILVLKPIQRRKLVKAWRKQSIPPVILSDLPPKNDTPNSQTDEINKKIGINAPSPLRNGESVSTMSSETEIISSVNESSSLSEQNCNWNNKRTIKLLELYTKYKTEFSHPDLEEQTVWKKIALKFPKCDELQCCNKIDELRCEYERIKNENVTSRKTAMFLDQAKKAFETTEITEETEPMLLLSLTRSNKEFLSDLLQVYAKYKTELACPNNEEQKVWGKIAKEMREKFSYPCGESLCRFELLQLKREYERLKRYGEKSENMIYLSDVVKEAFETSEKPGSSNLQIDEINKKTGIYVPPHLRNVERRQSVSTTSSETESIPPVKLSKSTPKSVQWKRDKCLVLLDVYAEYKSELSCSSVEEKHEVWKKIAEEVCQRGSFECNELQCMDNIKLLRHEYHAFKHNSKNELNEKTIGFFNKARNAFETSKNSDTSNSQTDEINKKIGIYIPPHLRNGESRQNVSTMSSETEIISPAASSSSSLICNWTMKGIIELLRRYANYKPEFSHPGVEEQTVWKKIALNYDESECRKKIDELRCEYERIKNENVTDRETAMLLDEAKKAFETTGTTEQTKPRFLLGPKKSSKDFLCKLLQVYAKYKTELACPNNEEQKVWEKIAKEMREKFSYACGETICRFELLQLKCQYESLKRDGVKDENIISLYHDAKEAFEASENPDNLFAEQSSNTPLLNCTRNGRNTEFCSKLLQVYAKYKIELASPDTEEQKVWEKITREMRETYSYDCSESLCRFELSQLKLEYENLAKEDAKSGNIVYLFDDAKEAFRTF